MLLAFASCAGLQGPQGLPGKDGTTPTIEISEDGYWVINGEKTDVKASSEDVVDENPQGLAFYMQYDGTYIVSCGNAMYMTNIIIPATYKGSEVVRILSFAQCPYLESVTIPDSVTSIDACAFYGCSSLKSITIPDSVTSIGDFAFEDCTSLKSITIPDSISSIGDRAFYRCSSLESIRIPNYVTNIGYEAFAGCYGFTSITIPASVMNIDAYAFYCCEFLTSITFEGTVAEWKAISKWTEWNGYVPATEVICSDGVVPLI